MAKKYSDEEYAKLLPKKQVGTAVLFFNSKDELLVVKPDYRDGWLVPGGSADADESPLQCAVRETREEIGLDLPELRLVGIYYGKSRGVFTDSLKFVFYGGILSDETITKIRLQTEELEEYRFAPAEEAIPLLSTSLQKSVPPCLDAIKNNTCAYIE